MIGFFVLLFGLCIGSFLNVCIYRIPEEESLFPSSRCSKCGYKVKWYDLIPILSYVILRGKCRRCGEKISMQYPIVEAINGGVYLLLYIKFGLTIIFFKYAFLTSIMLIMGFIDLNTQYVFTVISWTALLGVSAFGVFEFINGENVLSYIFAGVIGGGLFFCINLLSKILYKKQGLGWGDIEVIITMGLAFGIEKFSLAFFISIILGAVICLGLLGFKKITRESYVAFVPFLTLGSIITMIIGEEVIALYLNLIG